MCIMIMNNEVPEFQNMRQCIQTLLTPCTTSYHPKNKRMTQNIPINTLVTMLQKLFKNGGV